MNPGRENSEQARRRLLLGPAGCGKSRLLRTAFAEAVRAGDAEQVLLLVPTASYREHTRNEVLRESTLGGLAGDPICTFSDLLRRLAPATGPVLTGARRELLLRRLLSELALPEFRAVEEFPGFRAALAESVEELRRAGLTPEMLRAALPGREHRPFLSFFEAYDKALEKAGIDEHRRLRLAAGAIRSGALPLRLLLVDGFSDFTPEQRTLLEALLQTGPGAEGPAARIALTLDRQTVDRQSAGFFYQAERSRSWLQSLGFADQWLEGNHRAAQAPALAAVERLLRGEASAVAQGPGPAEPAAGSEPLVKIAAADRRDEIELMAREVLRLGRSGMPWRYMGIIVHQPAIYAPLLREAFRALGIPLRSFVPVPLRATAYGAHLRLCLDLFTAGSRPESIFRWLKSPYCTVRSRYVAEKFEYRAVERLAEAREGRWEEVLGSVRGGASGAPTWAAPIARVVASLERYDRELDRLNTPRAIADLAARAWQEFTRLPEVPEPADAERAVELRAEARAISQADVLLQELLEAAEQEERKGMNFVEFRELLLSVWAAEKAPVRDRRQDAVNLMSTYEARQWELDFVFVAGLIEKEFPSAPTEQPLVGDRARRAIRDTYGTALPTVADSLHDQHLLFYIAATRARRRLYLSYPQTDAAGKAFLRSYFLRGLEQLLDSEACRVVKRSRSDMTPPPDLASDTSDLLALAHSGLATRVPANAAPDSPERRTEARGVALYEALRETGASRRAALALAPRPPKLRQPEALALLQTQEEALHFSASAFGRFLQCQFGYFVERILRLKGPAMPEEIDPRREGEIAHRTIEQWTRGECREPVEQVLERCFAEGTAGIPPSHVARKSRAELQGALRLFAQFEDDRASRYRTNVDPAYIELRFGRGREAGKDDTTDRPAADALRFTLGDGTVVTVGGRLDRVELTGSGPQKAGLVVDFKYSASGFTRTLESIQTGEDLQLPIYLMALGELFGLTPAGAELYALKTDKRPRCGLYDADQASALFTADPPPGGLLLPHPEFVRLIDQARATIRQLAGSIRAGAIEPSSQNWKKCKDCDFAALCRVTRWEVEQRRLREAEAAQ